MSTVPLIAAMQARVARIGSRVLGAAPDIPQTYDFSFKGRAE